MIVTSFVFAHNTARRQCSLNAAYKAFSVLEFALPNGEFRPPSSLEIPSIALIALPIPLNLRGPVGTIRLRYTRPRRARMTVPEAPVHKDCQSLPNKRDVWAAGHVAPM